MSLGRRFVSTGAADAVCLTESVQVFGADSTYSSNIATYKFDGNSNDETGNYNATAQGSPSYVTGKFGQAASLSNSDTDYFTTSISPTILGNSFSLSAWIYVTQDSVGSDYYSIAGAYWNGSTGNQSWIFYIDNGTLKFFSNLSSGNIYVGSNTVPLNTWTFVGFSVDDKNEISVYLNDQVETSSVSLSLRSNSINLTLGNLGTYSAGRTLYGILDQVRVFNKSLNYNDFATLYAETDSTTSNTNPLSEGAGVALYSLDYDASEASGYYDGTPTDVDFGVGGQINYGARFNGSTSTIDVDATATTPIDFSSEVFSVSLWINPHSFSTENTFFAKYGTTGSASTHRTILMKTDTSGRFVVIENDGSSIYTQTSTATISANTYTFFAYTRSGSTSKIYINNNSAESQSRTNTIKNGSTQELTIGGVRSGVTDLDGDLDQVRIFSSTLTDTQISTLYAETACVHTATTNDENYPTTSSAYYKLDNSALDSKGTNNGTETDIEYRFGKYGQAAVFNGSSSGIGLPKNSTISPANDFTYSLWFKSDGTTFQTLFSHLGNTNPKYGAFLNHSSDASQSIRFFYSTGTNSQGNSSSSSNVWNVGKWHNLVITKSSTAGLKGYLDTIEIISNTALTADLTPYTLQNGNSNLGVYQYLTSGGNLYYMDGLIDQVRIFPSVLSSSYISQLYNEKPETDTSNFKAVLYTGTSSSQYISNVGFNLDVDNGGDGGYVWVKQRTTPTRHHRNYDTVRGVLPLYSSLDNLQGSINPIDYDANGFIFAGGESGVNENAEDYVAWVWRAGGQATNIGVNSITGSTPSIASDVSANTAAGFSIVKVTYNTSSPHTVAHGLSSAPEVIFGKRVSGSSVSAGDWNTYHKFIDPDTSAPETYFIKLNERDGRADNVIYWNDTAPTSSVFTTGSIYDQNETVIFYCWHSVSGYSKIGTYEGNGTTDNKIFTTDDGTSTGSNGFKPNFVMLKNVDRDNTGWLIHDTARDPVNTSYRTILANADTNEYVTTAYWLMDFESDGFRLKYGADNEFNRSGDTYIFMAFK